MVKTWLDASQEERENFEAFLESELAYRQYAKKTYSEKIGGDDISALAQKLLSDAGYTARRNHAGEIVGYTDAEGQSVPDNTVIRLAVDYLTENYSYTLTPAAPESDTGSVLSSFLFDVKEGYCTHFATAAAALVREFGYPVRYCEGYVANDFSRDYSTNAPSSYKSYALDEDARIRGSRSICRTSAGRNTKRRRNMPRPYTVRATNISRRHLSKLPRKTSRTKTSRRSNPRRPKPKRKRTNRRKNR